MELNRDKFRKWLEGHRPRQVVGRYTDEPKNTADQWRCNCPIANYLKAGGAKKPKVYTFMYGGDSSPCKAMPGWAMTFVRKVDEHLPDDSNANITASRALKILDGIEQ